MKTLPRLLAIILLNVAIVSAAALAPAAASATDNQLVKPGYEACLGDLPDCLKHNAG